MSVTTPDLLTAIVYECDREDDAYACGGVFYVPVEPMDKRPVSCPYCGLSLLKAKHGRPVVAFRRLHG